MTIIPITDFMIDVMYIVAPPSPLNKVHLKVCGLYFVKYMCFLTYVHMCLTSLIQKKKKKNECQCNYVIMSAFFPKYACHFLLAYF